jgi:hypothetical protein
MTNPLAINYALDWLAELNGHPFELEGISMLDGGRYQLLHYPKSERRTEHTDGRLSYEPCLTLEFGNGSVQPNNVALSRWKGRRVRVHGILTARLLPQKYAEMDILGILCPGAIEPYSIQRITADERRRS